MSSKIRILPLIVSLRDEWFEIITVSGELGKIRRRGAGQKFSLLE